MKKLQILEIDNYLYKLEDTDKKIYTLNLEFYDTDINVGDYIYIDDSVLKEKNIYTYGPITRNTDVEDYIKIIHNNKEIYLQRYYG